MAERKGTFNAGYRKAAENDNAGSLTTPIEPVSPPTPPSTTPPAPTSGGRGSAGGYVAEQNARAAYEAEQESKAILGRGAIVPSLNNNFNIAAFPAVSSNPLNKFVSYNCLFTLSCLRKDHQNNGVFKKSMIRNVIARSAGDWGDSNNRVHTQFGQFDYFLDDLIIVSQPSLSSKKGESFATKITFKVTEPYSMGLFLIAMNEGAKDGGSNQGYENFREGSYLLTIEFAGYTDDTKPHAPDPTLTRYIPIKFLDVKLKVTSGGSTYECEVIPYNEIAFRDPIGNTRDTVALAGSTVEQLLTTGDKSLVKFLENEAKTLVKDKESTEIDTYDIQFPKSFSEKIPSGNDIASGIVFDMTSTGNMSFPNQNDMYDPLKGIYKDKSVGTITKERTFNFSKGSKIQDIITEVIMKSDYITKQLTNASIKLNTKGMLNWFRVEAQVYDDKQSKKLNRQIRKTVYRVVPYEMHISKILPPNAIPEGYATLKKTVNRIYDYLYTGKNTEIINIDIDFNMGFFTKLSGDAGNKPATDNDGQNLFTNNRNPNEGSSEAKNPKYGNESQTAIYYGVTDYKQGKSGADTPETAQVKNYREIFMNEGDMVEIKMTIRGDPYYLPSSGMGNQIGVPSGDNLMVDGSMNYQSGEVDIVLNFRTPIDFNPDTGLYNFNTSIDQFSGLYQIFEVESKFNQNKFTQTISAMRRRTQLRGSGEKSVLLSTQQ
jgi:hypothetical protein